MERRGHCFARYADDCNVYVGSLRAGKRVMAVLRKLNAKLHLRVNEAKSAVASVFGRKFLGYSFWAAKGAVVKRRVANKPLATFKQRIRQLTRRSGGRSVPEVVERLRPYLLGWKAYFGLSQTPRSGESSTSGCGTDCGPFSSSNGSAARPSFGNCAPWAHLTVWRNEWRLTPGAGGAIAPCCSTAY